MGLYHNDIMTAIYAVFSMKITIYMMNIIFKFMKN